MANGTKLRVEALAHNVLLQSDGSGNWSFRDLDLPDVEGWGPYLESITVHTQTRDLAPNFQWKVVSWYSLDGRTWVGPHDLFPAISVNGDVVQAPFTDKTKMGLKMKYSLAAKDNATGRLTALVSAAGAFSFLT